MKVFFAIILALGIGFAAAYIIVSRQKDAQLEQLKAQPPVTVATPAPAPAPVEKVVMAAAPSAPPEESAQDILDDLLNVKLDAGSGRNAGLRLVVFKLETLAQRGRLAVPAIRAFIGRNVDVDYGQQDTQNQNDQSQAVATTGNVANADQNNNSNAGFNRRNRSDGSGFFGAARSAARRARNLQTLRADWVVPPSLRLGLVGVLKQIGGAESEQALAEMLNSTGRGVEVAYLAATLEDIAPGKYRDAAVAAAKELLMNPPAVDSPDRLDDLSKSYLYGVLEFYNDASFAINAQQLLVGADGRLDQDALDYLSVVMKDQSISALYAAYENPALTNQIDKTRLSRELMNYVGQSSQANQVFTETLNNPDVDPRAKAITVLQLAGGFDPSTGDAPTDPQVISSRITLLNSLQPQFANDPVLSKAIPAAINSLQNPGQPIEMQDILGAIPNRRPRQQNNNNGNGAGAIVPAGP